MSIEDTVDQIVKEGIHVERRANTNKDGLKVVDVDNLGDGESVILYFNNGESVTWNTKGLYEPELGNLRMQVLTQNGKIKGMSDRIEELEDALRFIQSQEESYDTEENALAEIFLKCGEALGNR